MKFTPSRLLCLIGFLVLPMAANAQWQWVDQHGKKVFSDQPPPIDVPERNIQRRPYGSPAPRAADPAPGAESGTAAEGESQASAKADTGADAAKAPRVDKELEEKTRKAEEAEKAKRAAEEQRIAKARAENCQRARQSKATLDSGMRMARVNAKGEREILDDEARAAEQRRVQAVINSDCK